MHTPAFDPRPSFWRKTASAAVCSILFVVVYNACTQITATRSDVGTWYYAWEFAIPFIPPSIIPYWSIDLLYVLSFFLCTSRSELSVHSKRIAAATLLAGACFLAFPLRLGFPRPDVDGFCGKLFDLLHAFDQPYNLFPSLHIALWLLLRQVYVRHVPRWLAWPVKIWFALIALSTLFTWQHHIIDILGGVILAIVCFYLFPQHPLRWHVTPNYRIATYYATGALLLTALGHLLRPWGLLLCYPAFSLAITTTAYLRLGPSIFGKTAGQIPLSARVLLFPLLLGQHLSLRHYMRGCRPWDQLTPDLWIGRLLTRAECTQAIASRAGVRTVIDLTGEFSSNWPSDQITYINHPILDLTAPTLPDLQHLAELIEQHRQHGTVYIHCKIGYSRTAAVAGAWLLHTGRATTADEALAHLRRARPSIIIRPEAEAAIRAFANTCKPLIHESTRMNTNHS